MSPTKCTVYPVLLSADAASSYKPQLTSLFLLVTNYRNTAFYGLYGNQHISQQEPKTLALGVESFYNGKKYSYKFSCWETCTDFLNARLCVCVSVCVCVCELYWLWTKSGAS